MSTAIDSRESVLVGYGEVMSIVQLWELALALVWWGQTPKERLPAGDFDTPRSQKEIRRLEAAFLRASAQSVREAVKPHLEPKTADGLDALMKERNRLAHSYLRDQAADSEDAFKPGTHQELILVGGRFMESLESIMRTIMDRDPYEGPVLPHWPALAQRLVERVFSGEAIPRDPERQ